MKNTVLYILWAVLYAMCAIVSLAPLPGIGGTVFSALLSCLFFLPGAILVYRGVRQKNRRLLRSVRIISLCSLVLTFVLLVSSFLTVLGSETLGNVLHVLLALVSVPMISSGYWVVSLFLWACLLMSTLVFRRRD